MSAVKIAVLRAVGTKAKAVDLLAKAFSVISLDRASAAEPIGIVADSASAQQALTHIVARPETVNALALIAPPALDAHFVEKLSGVTIPVLALFGTRDDTAQAHGAVYRKALPNCNVTFVYDAGADMANERPEAVAAALTEFMRQRERYVVTDKSAKLYP
jgi:pimeloyl-ACP methyl ester carboxylesterase